MSGVKRTAIIGLAVLVAAVGYSLVHANAASAQVPVSVVTTPLADTNDVGTTHTLTATVQCFPLACSAGSTGPMVGHGGWGDPCGWNHVHRFDRGYAVQLH